MNNLILAGSTILFGFGVINAEAQYTMPTKTEQSKNLQLIFERNRAIDSAVTALNTNQVMIYNHQSLDAELQGDSIWHIYPKKNKNKKVFTFGGIDVYVNRQTGKVIKIDRSK